MHTTGYLLSFPRSGNTWIRYCVEYLSKLPTWESEDSTLSFGKIFPDISINIIEGPILIKTHQYINKNKKTDLCDKKIVFLIRNCYDAIISQYEKQTRYLPIESLVDWYISLIYKYDEHKKDKICLYYENFLQHPEEQLLKLIRFLNISEEYLCIFLEDYQYHYNRCNEYYKNINMVRRNIKNDKNITQKIATLINLRFNKHSVIYQRYFGNNINEIKT